MLPLRCLIVLPCLAVTVQGKSISVSSSDGLAAIDTGTTLIGAPSSVTQEIWSNVPGSVPLTDEYEGIYSFRKCGQSFRVLHGIHVIHSMQHRGHRHPLFWWQHLAHQHC